MDVLTLGSKNYIKASVIARDLGYTADYVGQLCRSGKIDAKLVGRSWYVNRDSIHAHKKTRYRSNTQKSLDTLRTSIRTDESEPVHISHFYTQHATKRSTAYASDETELYPQTSKHKKTALLKVDLADSKEVPVQDQGEDYVFSKPDLPEVRFSGTLRVKEYEAVNPVVEQGGKLIHPKDVQDFKDKKTSKNIAISSKTEQDEIEDSEPSETSHLTFTDKLAAIEEKEQLQVPVSLSENADGEAIAKLEVNSSVSFFWITLPLLTFIIGLLCVAGLWSLDAQVTSANGQLAKQYTFDIHRFEFDVMDYSRVIESILIHKK